MWYEDLKNGKRRDVSNERKIAGIKIRRRRQNLIQYYLGNLQLNHYLRANLFLLNRRGKYERVDRQMLRRWIKTNRVVADGDVRDVIVDLVMTGERIIL